MTNIQKAKRKEMGYVPKLIPSLDYDGMLTTPSRIGSCGCLGHGLMKRNRIQKRYEKDYSKMQRRYAPDDWPEWDDGDAVPTLHF